MALSGFGSFRKDSYNHDEHIVFNKLEAGMIAFVY